MDYIELEARAKINLSLDVTGKRPDGYHDVRMIMQTISLHDRVHIEKTGAGIGVGCNSQWVPSGEANIAYKAALSIFERFGIRTGIKVMIDKRIPVAAGLAGGSTDAASVIKGINGLFDLGLTSEEMMDIGKSIGADVPYCIKGGTMLAEGIGEILTPLKPLESVPVVLVKPHIGVSTAWVYKSLNVGEINIRPDTSLLVKALQNRDVGLLAGNMVNVLETVTVERYHVIEEIKGKLVEYGAAGSIMSGSGPSVFGLFESREGAEYAFERIKSRRWDSFLTETCNI